MNSTDDTNAIEATGSATTAYALPSKTRRWQDIGIAGAVLASSLGVFAAVDAFAHIIGG